jgi:hypothetical protein
MQRWGGQDKFLFALPRPPAGPLAVEKLTHQKMPGKTLQQEALQTTFSFFVDIFYPPNFRCFEENGLFQQPQAITLVTLRLRIPHRPPVYLGPGSQLQLLQKGVDPGRRSTFPRLVPIGPSLPQNLTRCRPRPAFREELHSVGGIAYFQWSPVFRQNSFSIICFASRPALW